MWWLNFVLLLAAAATVTVEEKRQASKLRAEGDSLLVSGDAQSALLKYSAATKLEPTELKNYMKMYKANDRLKRPASQLRDLSQALENCPVNDERATTLQLRSHLLVAQGRCAEALHDLNLLLQAHPTTQAGKQAAEIKPRVEYCVNLVHEADKFMDRGEYQRADETLTLAIESIKTAAVDIKKKRALARYLRGDHFECIADAGEVVKSDRNDVDMLTLRGQAYYSLGDFDMASRHTAEALQSDPDFAKARTLHKSISALRKAMNLANKLFIDQQFQPAMDKFASVEMAFAPLPVVTHRDMLLNMCRCAGKLKQREAVHTTCIRSMQLDEHWIDVRIAYAEILHDMAETSEEWEEVVRETKKALGMDQQQNGKLHDLLRRSEAALKQSRTKNYYAILSVKRTAQQAEIKRAYRDMAKKYHPDRHAGLSGEDKKNMEKKFQDCAEAYEVLSDDEKRQKYDRGEDVFENQGGGGGGHHFHHFHRQQGFHFGFGF